jgi:hypothetical protein
MMRPEAAAAFNTGSTGAGLNSDAMPEAHAHSASTAHGIRTNGRTRRRSSDGDAEFGGRTVMACSMSGATAGRTVRRDPKWSQEFPGNAYQAPDSGTYVKDRRAKREWTVLVGERTRARTSVESCRDYTEPAAALREIFGSRSTSPAISCVAPSSVSTCSGAFIACTTRSIEPIPTRISASACPAGIGCSARSGPPHRWDTRRSSSESKDEPWMTGCPSRRCLQTRSWPNVLPAPESARNEGGG